MKNSAVLIDWYGGDKRVALSAWQSTNIELGIELSPDVKQRIEQLYWATIRNKEKTPEKLLMFLGKHNHTSPFRKALLDFQLTAEIASHIHSLKHRIGVEINSESSRYKELKDKYYIPEDWNIKADDEELKKANLSMFRGMTWAEILEDHTIQGNLLYHQAIQQIGPFLGRKRVKESARFFFGYNKQLDYDMQFSFEAFVHFQKLRNSEHAQVEIREIAQSMLEQVKAIDGIDTNIIKLK
jgi:thymidylate synthase (FAD)